MLNWNLLKYFYYLCQLRNVTQVANYCNVSQPCVSKKIKELEKQLHKKLIISSNTGISLTDEGIELQKELKPVFDILSKIESASFITDKNYHTTIKIAAGYRTVENYIIPATTIMSKNYPNIKFHIETYSLQETIQKLKLGKIDIAFFSRDISNQLEENFIVKKCYSFRDSFIVSTKIRNEYPDKLDVKKLNDYPIIIKDKSSQSRILLDTELECYGIELTPKYEVGTYMEVENLMMSNRGIGFCSIDLMRNKIKDGTFVEIPCNISLPERYEYYAYAKNCRAENVIDEFIVTLKKLIK